MLSVLLMVAVMVVLAATMVALYTSNLSFTQAFYNGSVALDEAEAGINEVMFWLTRDDTMSFGLNDEEIRGTLTSQFDPSGAYHLVTFRSGTGFPHSTNNVNNDRDMGYGGRTVPDGTVHVISTGYCRGKYRTIEAVITRPPFPFGLASSGKIHSINPLIIKGTSSVDNYQDDEEDRPGHLLCNSAEGVVIEQVNPPTPTRISGFVKSVGPIQVEPPAEILGGIRPGADPSTLVDIDVESFRNQGQPGVVTLIDDTFTEPQDLDIMYYFTGTKLTYQGSVALDSAMLYVDGDLEIAGSLTGTGLVVVNGDVVIGQGAALDGDSKLALLATGDVFLRGGSSHFQGLVYCEGNLDARNVTIVGNTIVTSADETRGNAVLDQVTLVSNEETANMTITVTSSTQAQSQRNGPRAAFPLGMAPAVPPAVGYVGYDPNRPGDDQGGADGWPGDGASGEVLMGQLESIWSDWVDDLALPDEADPQFTAGLYAHPDAGGLVSQLRELYDLAAQAADYRDERRRVGEIQEELQGMPPGPARTGLENEKADLEDTINTNYNPLRQQWDLAKGEMVGAYMAYMKAHTDENGNYDDGSMEMDVVREFKFDLNTYLPESERIKVVYWHVTNRRI
ncbi:MAG: hypothetical protein HY319_29465 [Armatimonadetes bacterium]|nr:hypothetical protein [Armatimonadota bacterium]